VKPQPAYRCRTGHAAYGFILLDGIRYAQCCECGHRWLIVLRPYDNTDGLPAEMPGIALR